VHWRVATSELAESNKLLLLSLSSPDAAGQWHIIISIEFKSGGGKNYTCNVV